MAALPRRFESESGDGGLPTFSRLASEGAFPLTGFRFTLFYQGI